MDTPNLSEAETEAIYTGLERAGRCEQFIDRFAGCAAGEAECHCFAIGVRIIEARRISAGALTPTGEALVAERDRYRHALANILARYGATPTRPKNDYEAGVLHEAEQMSMIAEEALAGEGRSPLRELTKLVGDATIGK